VEVQPQEVTIHQPEVLDQVAVLLLVDRREAAHTIEVHPEPAAVAHTILRVLEVTHLQGAVFQEVVLQGVVPQVHAVVAAAVLQVHAAVAVVVPQDHQVGDNYLHNAIIFKL